MNAHRNVSEMLEALAKAHAHDKDGGYSYAFALRDLYTTLERDEQAELVHTLVSSVLEREGIWRVGIEALIQIGALDRADALVAAVRSGAHDWEWRDDVVFALLSLQYPVQGDFYDEYVKRAIDEERPHAVPLAAALSRIHSAQSCLLLGDWLVRAYAKGKAVRGYAATIVRNYLAVDEWLLVDLVHKVGQQDASASRSLAGALKTYLGKPRMLKELGEERCTRIQRAIAAAVEPAD